jgi:hypothetical protein
LELIVAPVLVMFGKGNVRADEQSKDKKSYGGMRIAVVGCHHGLNELIVKVIKKNED